MKGNSMEYRIVEASSCSFLEFSVKSLIADGWVPQGGIAVSFTDGGWIRGYVQAMVKHPPLTSHWITSEPLIASVASTGVITQ